MLRQDDATKHAQEENEKGMKLFLLQIFRLRESYFFGAAAKQTGPDFTCSERDEKSREPTHACRGYGQEFTGYANALRVGKE
jgi:hypothetical protein